MRHAPVERLAVLSLFAALIPASSRADDVPPPPSRPHKAVLSPAAVVAPAAGVNVRIRAATGTPRG
jgi:hypothetical protein